MQDIKIGIRYIGRNHPPFIIAEMSGNHNQSLDRAIAIVEAAAASGAHAVKLQTYTPDTMTIDLDRDDFVINDPNSLWNGEALYKLYKQAHTPWEWHGPIFKRCRELDIIAFSTPFDETAVDFLEGFAIPAYKIASFENNHLPLIRKVARTGKPIIMSTGMASIAELDEAVKAARDAGCKEIVLLKCTSTYPATPGDSNLLTIAHMRQLFNTEVGLSDHTLGIGAAIAGVALGATVVEKHFTLSRADGGVDSAFSMEPAEMKMLVNETLGAWQSLGEISYGTTKKEEESLKFRRSVFVVDNIKTGETFTPENLRIIRPGNGLAPRFYDVLLGKKSSCDLQKGTPMSWEYLV